MKKSIKNLIIWLWIATSISQADAQNLPDTNDSHKNIFTEQIQQIKAPKTQQTKTIKTQEVANVLSMTHEDIIRQNIEKLDIKTYREHLLIEINKFRASHKMKIFEFDKTLNKTAQEYAKYMHDNNYVQTQTKDRTHYWKDNSTVYDRAKKNWFRPFSINENIITLVSNDFDPMTINRAMNWRLNSPKHLLNIMSDTEYIWIWMYIWNNWVYLVTVQWTPKY